MKKMMKAVCGAMLALAGTAFGLNASPCGSCGESVAEGCQIWFKGTASGKISCGVANQTYKKVVGLTAKDCQLVIFDDGSNVTAKVVLTAKKKGVATVTKELDCSEFKWNVFGKDTGSAKKNYKLESEIFFQAFDEDGTTFVQGVLFGTVKAKSSGSGCGPCGGTISTKYTPASFKGYFTGFAPASGCACADELTAVLGECESCTNDCLGFDEQDEKMEYFGGVVTLKYDSKNSGCR